MASLPSYPTEYHNGPERPPPRVWLVIGDKLGDNAQVEVLAAALPWPVEVRRLRFLEQYQLGKPRFKASLYHVDRDKSDPLAAPWPDLVLTIGRRPSMAALWIKEQSGGRTKLVIVGRPRRHMDRFDLIIGTSLYRLPDSPRIVRLGLPLMRIDHARIDAAREVWRERLAPLPRPLTAVLIGGATKPFAFDADVAATLLDGLQDMQRRDGGSLYLTTSRRTGAAVNDALAANLPAGGQLFRWRADATDNPYLGLLALADRFVVTGDSISMMVEVARLGRPLAIFPLPVRRSFRDGIVAGLAERLQGSADGAGGGPLRWLGDALGDLGLIGPSRDFDALHGHLFRTGLAVPFGQPFPDTPPDCADELAAAAERIRQLLP